jgi:parallel beta-helix repeat protein
MYSVANHFSSTLFWSAFAALAGTADAHGASVRVTNAAELSAAISSVTPGSTILLASGFYGTLSINGRSNSDYVTIAADAGSVPVLTSVSISSSAYWILQGLSVEPRYDSEAAERVAVSLNGNHLKLINAQISYANTLPTSPSDWMARVGHGVYLGGSHNTVQGNTLRYVRRGIEVDADNSLIGANLIQDFSADAIRGNGNYDTFEYNVVKDCYISDPNDHYDAFQSWSNGPGGVGTGSVIGNILRGNTIIESTNMSRVSGCYLQGIGMFDGTYDSWRIENNLIVTNHWHGIAVYGGRNVVVINNTAVNPYGNANTWIEIVNHKNGTPSTGVLRNNLSHQFPSGGRGVISDRNVVVRRSSMASYFVNPSGMDYHLSSASPAIDVGSGNLAPSVDLDGHERPAGRGFDVGAYEFHAATSAPEPIPTPGPTPTKRNSASGKDAEGR